MPASRLIAGRFDRLRTGTPRSYITYKKLEKFKGASIWQK
jgi:hypothetical protein